MDKKVTEKNDENLQETINDQMSKRIDKTAKDMVKELVKCFIKGQLPKNKKQMEEKVKKIAFKKALDLLNNKFDANLDENKGLKDYLSDFSVDDLVYILSKYTFNTQTVDLKEKYSKEQLIQEILDSVENNFENILYGLDSDVLNVFKSVAEEEKILECTQDANYGMALICAQSRGLIFINNTKKHIYYHMPIEIRKKFQELETVNLEEQLDDTEIILVGMLTTYGVIEVDYIYEILSKKMTISKERLINYLKYIAYKEDSYCVYHDELKVIYDVFIDGSKIDKTLIHKKRQVFKKYDYGFFVKMVNDEYLKNLDEFKNLCNFLKKTIGNNDNQDIEYISNIIINNNAPYQVSSDNGLKYIKKDVSEFCNLYRISEDSSDILVNEVVKVLKRFPIWEDGGRIEDPNSLKAGRNSICPCGSGKKYKKCCGK